MAKSKPGIYEILNRDGSKTRVYANSIAAAKRSVGGSKISVTWIADNWPDSQKTPTSEPVK